MGMVSVTVRGSFPEHAQDTYSAEEGGHALALQRAIARLTGMLPKAIQLDHQLHGDGEQPPKAPFGHAVQPPTPRSER
jgi:hypothetical protein